MRKKSFFIKRDLASSFQESNNFLCKGKGENFWKASLQRGYTAPMEALKIPFSWEERRPVFLDHFLYIPPLYEDHAAFEKFSWKDLFGCERSLHVEFCSGSGAWIVQKAQDNPDVQWIAVEKQFVRAKKIWQKIFRNGLKNLFVVCGEGLTFLKFYAEQEAFSEVFINFPDPWPKRRHARHRIISLEFLEKVRLSSRKGAKLTLVTDDLEYVHWMLLHIQKSGSFVSLCKPPYYTTALEGYGSSFFQELWESKGRSIYYLLYEML